MSSTTPSHSSVLQHPIVLAVARSLFGFPIEHPLEVMKMKAQADPHLTLVEVIKKLISTKGLIGFSDTLLLNLPRRTLRETSRWTVIDVLHRRLIEQFPAHFTHEGVESKIATAVGSALFNAVFLYPIEQLMYYRIKENKQYRKFYGDRYQNTGVLSLYRGVHINFARECLAWGMFMAMNNQIKRKLAVLDKDNDHPYFNQFCTSFLIASMITPVALPLDFIKSRIQMDKELQAKKVSVVIKTLFKQYGVRGFYAGIAPVFVQSMFQATVKGLIADLIFRSHQTSTN